MDPIRSTSWLVSFGLHAAIVVGFVGVVVSGGSALDEGSGSDLVVVEQGIAVEGLANLGEAEEMIETVDIPAVQEVAELREVQEIEPELTEIISSTESTTEELVEIQEPEPLEEEVEEEEVAEVPIEEIAPQVATLIEKSSGAEQTGGDTNAYQLYKGKLFKAIVKKKVVPRTRKSGTVTLEFYVSPKGELLDHKIVKSSGSSKLDEAALASLVRAAPFPPIPELVGSEAQRFTIPFKYSVR